MVESIRKNNSGPIQSFKQLSRKRCAGFTLVEIMIVVAIIGLLAAIALPNFLKSRDETQENACVNNLRRIEYGKEQWAMEMGKSTGSTPDAAEVNLHIKGGAPDCPSSGTYTYNNIGTDATCTVGGHVMPN